MFGSRERPHGPQPILNRANVLGCGPHARPNEWMESMGLPGGSQTVPTERDEADRQPDEAVRFPSPVWARGRRDRRANGGVFGVEIEGVPL